MAPKTAWGRLITILYALVGIPLTFLYLSNIGNVLAEGFRLFYKRICCDLCCCQKCERKKKRERFRTRRRRELAAQRNSMLRSPSDVQFMTIDETMNNPECQSLTDHMSDHIDENIEPGEERNDGNETQNSDLEQAAGGTDGDCNNGCPSSPCSNTTQSSAAPNTPDSPAAKLNHLPYPERHSPLETTILDDDMANLKETAILDDDDEEDDGIRETAILDDDVDDLLFVNRHTAQTPDDQTVLDNLHGLVDAKETDIIDDEDYYDDDEFPDDVFLPAEDIDIGPSSSSVQRGSTRDPTLHRQRSSKRHKDRSTSKDARKKSPKDRNKYKSKKDRSKSRDKRDRPKERSESKDKKDKDKKDREGKGSDKDKDKHRQSDGETKDKKGRKDKSSREKSKENRDKLKDKEIEDADPSKSDDKEKGKDHPLTRDRSKAKKHKDKDREREKDSGVSKERSPSHDKRGRRGGISIERPSSKEDKKHHKDSHISKERTSSQKSKDHINIDDDRTLSRSRSQRRSKKDSHNGKSKRKESKKWRLPSKKRKSGDEEETRKLTDPDTKGLYGSEESFVTAHSESFAEDITGLSDNEDKLGLDGIVKFQPDVAMDYPHDIELIDYDMKDATPLGFVEDPFEFEEEEQTEKVTVPISICLIIIATYIFAGSVLFTLWEEWDYLTGSYFCFITLSTIGFGDIVPGTDMKEWASHEKLVLCALWLALGLSLLAMCFNLMQEEVKEKCKWLGTKLGLLRDEDEG